MGSVHWICRAGSELLPLGPQIMTRDWKIKIVALLLLIGAWAAFFWKSHHPLLRMLAMILIIAGVTVIRSRQSSKAENSLARDQIANNNFSFSRIDRPQIFILIGAVLLFAVSLVLLLYGQAMGIISPWPVYLFGASVMILVFSALAVVQGLWK